MPTLTIMKKDILCIGHITKDKIVTPQTTKYQPGGTSFYFSYGILNLGLDDLTYSLLTSLAEEDMKVVQEMRDAGLEVEVIPSRKTVFFENIYEEDTDHRRQRVVSKADPFEVTKLNDVEARYIVLGSLLADDFSIEAIKQLSSKGTLVVDAQGYLRKVEGEKVYATDWKGKHEALKYIDILKVNEEEALVLTGKEDMREAALQLAEWGVKEVLLTLGASGSLILENGVLHKIPAYTPSNTIDATGCGDTFVLGYIYMRAQGASVEDAGKFAAATSTLKLESFGPFSRSRKDVMERIAKA